MQSVAQDNLTSTVNSQSVQLQISVWLMFILFKYININLLWPFPVFCDTAAWLACCLSSAGSKRNRNKQSFDWIVLTNNEILVYIRALDQTQQCQSQIKLWHVFFITIISLLDRFIFFSLSRHINWKLTYLNKIRPSSLVQLSRYFRIKLCVYIILTQLLTKRTEKCLAYQWLVLPSTHPLSIKFLHS